MTMLPLDDENTPDEPVTDAAGQTVTTDDDDAPLTAADLAHAKHAAAVATGQASVAPPPIEAPPASEAPRQRNRRKDAGQPRAPRKPKSGDPVSADMLAPPSDVQVSVTLNPIDGKLTAEAINAAAAADADPESDGISIRGKRNRAIFVDEAATKEPGIPCDLPREVVPGTTSDRQLGSNDIDTKSIARARLKVYGKFAARARAAAQLWPKDPVRYFDTVGKIFTDLAHGECRVDALRYDRAAVAELVIGLLPKATIEVIDCSGITNI